MSDPRFARLNTDPRFRRPRKTNPKLAIDDRFNAALQSLDSTKTSRVDKYGRVIKNSQDTDNARRFYRTNQADLQDHDATNLPDYARGENLLDSSSDEDADDDQDTETDDGREVVLGRAASKPIHIPTDDDHPEFDLNEDDQIYNDLDAQAAAYNASHNDDQASADIDTLKTNRIAVVNLDWDHVRATHLYKIFSSLVSVTALPAAISRTANVHPSRKSILKPPVDKATVVKGEVLSVHIYPSQFGKERLKKEEVEGPPKEVFKKSRRGDIDVEEEVNERTIYQEDEGDEYDEDALRKYQLERLRYYYAIITCDTVDAAAHIYAELDGTELERTANVFDLSFVPDGMTFDDDPRDSATPATESGSGLTHRLDFSTSALRHSKVKLTWDEDDPERNKVTRRTLTKKEIDEGNFKSFIASSESESSDVEFPVSTASKKSQSDKAERDRLRTLLLGGDEDETLPEGWGGASAGAKGEEGDMEITFMPGLSGAQDAVDKEETTLEAYKRKQKEKRLQRMKEKGANDKATSGARVEKAVEVKERDDFFDENSGSDATNEPAAHNPRKAKNQKDKSQARPVTTEAELALLAASDNPTAEPKHFDMKAVLKAEKNTGKKQHRKTKKKGDAGDAEIQEDFNIDVKDDRFTALHDNHVFAIDPSNPHFKKTKSMAALLGERAKRQKEKQYIAKDTVQAMEAYGEDRSLQSLVESVKRKSGATSSHRGMGKRRRV